MSSRLVAGLRPALLSLVAALPRVMKGQHETSLFIMSAFAESGQRQSQSARQTYVLGIKPKVCDCQHKYKKFNFHLLKHANVKHSNILSYFYSSVLGLCVTDCQVPVV